MADADQRARDYVLATQRKGGTISKENFESWCRHDPALNERTLQAAIWARVPHHAQFDQTKMTDDDGPAHPRKD
jgi:hypothetical protein